MPRIRLCSRLASDGPSVGTGSGNPWGGTGRVRAAKSVSDLRSVPLCAGRAAAATGFATEISCDPPLMTADASFGLLGSITRLRYISLATTRVAPFDTAISETVRLNCVVGSLVL